MTESELLAMVVDHLRRVSIPHMLTGSVASAYHGSPRATHDIDILVEAAWPELLDFVRSFPPPFYVSEEAARQACTRGSIFNIIHPSSETKVDIIVMKDEPFSREEFGRRRPAVVWGVSLDIVSPEDLILAKLRWARQSHSETQHEDALNVALTHAPALDTAYLEEWAARIGLSDALAELLAELPPLDAS